MISAYSKSLNYIPKYLNIYLYIKLCSKVNNFICEYMNTEKYFGRSLLRHSSSMIKFIVPVLFFSVFIIKTASAAPIDLNIVSQLSFVKFVLSQLGPAISAVMFVIAGIFYSLGQIMPPDKKAHFHTTAINIIIGAIVVGILSVASTTLASASSGLLNNVSAANFTSK